MMRQGTLSGESKHQAGQAPWLTRLGGKLSGWLERLARQSRRSVARAFYALPGQTGSNPRNRIRKISDCCRRVGTVEDLMASNAGDDAYVVLQKRQTYRRQWPQMTGPGDLKRIVAAGERYQGGCAFEAPDVFLARLHRARIYSREFLVFTERGDLVFESAMSQDEVLEKNGVLDRLSSPRGLPKAGRYALFAHPWAYGYYHWLLEVLPRLSLLEQDPRVAELPLIVSGQLKKFQKETLQMIGIGERRLVPFDGECLEVEELYFPSLPAPSGNPSPHAVEWLRRMFLSETRSPPATTERMGRKLYLTRKDAPQRRLLNEAEIGAWLENRGFEIYCSGNHSFEDQVNTFSQASCVIAPHGAAVSNMVFAPSSARLIEFFGRNYVNGCYWALANIRQQTYGCLTGEATGLDYTISLDALQEMMEANGM